MRHYKIAAASLLLVSAVATAAYAAVRFKEVAIRPTNGNLSTQAAEARALGADTQPVHGGLFITFREVGLGSNDGTNYLVTADATATYGCINRGSKHPKASNKQTVSGPVSASATFTSDNNGNVSGAIAIAPLPAGDFSCPPGQSLELISVSYSNVVLADVTNGISASFPGPYTLSMF